MYSQQRGPRAATAFADSMKKNYPSSKCKIAYLRGGFAGWANLYVGHKNQNQLIENLDIKMWA